MKAETSSPPNSVGPNCNGYTGSVTVLGVDVTNLTTQAAIRLMAQWVGEAQRRCHAVYIVNAHTLNLAWADAEYARVLRSADVVFGDGTGVRMAARWRGVEMLDNLVGTDLMPAMMADAAGSRFSYYLLGGHDGVAERAAQTLREQFPGIRIAGAHHGYLDREASLRVIDEINSSGADILMVAMGNPDQERWIDTHRERLRVPVAVGVGGLFDHWAGNLVRAPKWMRRLGMEWVQILMQQPGRKWRRYLLGNPLFLARMIRAPRGGGASASVRSSEDARDS